MSKLWRNGTSQQGPPNYRFVVLCNKAPLFCLLIALSTLFICILPFYAIPSAPPSLAGAEHKRAPWELRPVWGFEHKCLVSLFDFLSCEVIQNSWAPFSLGVTVRPNERGPQNFELLRRIKNWIKKRFSIIYFFRTKHLCSKPQTGLNSQLAPLCSAPASERLHNIVKCR